MRRSWKLLAGTFVFTATILGCSSKGPAGDKGEQGPPGSPAPTTATLTGTVFDGVANTPLGGVAITVKNTGAVVATTATGPDGKFTVSVAAGILDVDFAKTDYTSPGTMQVAANAGYTLDLDVTMNESASGKPSVTVAAPGNDIGFGATIPLVATASDPNGDPLTYVWSNATASAIGTVTGNTATGSVTMPTMAEAFAKRVDPANPGAFISGYTLESRFGIVPIINDTRGQITAKLVVSDGRGQSTSVSTVINAASIVIGHRNVPLGTRVYLNSGRDTGNSWTLAVPANSTATLDDPTVRTPSFVPDVFGTYTLTENGATPANSISISGGSWAGMIDGGSGDNVEFLSGCQACHNGVAAPDKFTPWLETKHATMFTRGINGKLSPSYSQSCIECHTVGYDKGVGGEGFDDAAAKEGWSFPSTLSATNWDDMVANAPSVARLANIQCESCHGPQVTALHGSLNVPFVQGRISYKAEACGTCHASGSSHHIYSEWNTQAPINASGVAMGHSNRGMIKLGASATSLSSSCGRCHTAQGYTLYAGVLKQGKVALNSVPSATMSSITTANAEPVTCVACHDPHDATNPQQLRFYGDTPMLPGGFAGYGMGKGALCLSCHNSRNGTQNGSDVLTFLHEDGETYNSGNPTGYSAPHQADQGDVFMGRNAYFMGTSLPLLSKHAAIEDTCVGCHMTLQPKGYLSHGAPVKSGHLFRIEDEDLGTLCANCHGANVNGEGIQAQIETLLGNLGAKMGNAVKAKANAVAGGSIRVRAWDPVTDFYSSPSNTSLSNVLIDVTANPITSVGIEEIHGQVGFVLTFTNPVTGVPFVDGAGNVQPSKDLQTIAVQMGALKDNQATPAALYALSGNMIRAGWNYFLIEGDQSKGLHNPTFATAVLNNSIAKDLSN